MEKRNEKREKLKELSSDLKASMESNIKNPFSNCHTINQALLKYYRKGNKALDFNTFKQWQEKGYKVKKGSKAYAVWGAPRKFAKKGVDKPKEDLTKEDTYKAFPIANLFSSDQVEKVEE